MARMPVSLEEEEGEVIEHPRSTSPPPPSIATAVPRAASNSATSIKISGIGAAKGDKEEGKSANPTLSTSSSTATPATPAAPTRAKINFGLAGKAINKQLSATSSATNKKSLNDLAKSKPSPKAPFAVLGEAGRAKREASREEGEESESGKGKGKEREGVSRGGESTGSGLGVAGLPPKPSFKDDKMEPASSSTSNGGGNVALHPLPSPSKDSTSPVRFRQRASKKRDASGSHSTNRPTPSPVISSADLEAAKLLKQETVVVPDLFSPPKAERVLPAMRMDQIDISSGGLPYDGQSVEVAPLREDRGVRGDWNRDREVSQRRDGLFKDNGRDDHRYTRGEYDDRYGGGGRGGGGGRYEGDRRYDEGNYGGRREPSPRRYSPRRSQHPDEDRYSKHHQHQRRRSRSRSPPRRRKVDERRSPRRDQDRSEPPPYKKAKRSPSVESRRSRRSPSRTPMSEDEDEARYSRSPELSRKSVMSPRRRDQVERDIKEGRLRRGHGEDRTTRDKRRIEERSNGDYQRRRTPSLSPPRVTNRLNPSLPAKPVQAIESLAPPHRSRAQPYSLSPADTFVPLPSSSRAPISFDLSQQQQPPQGGFRSRMGPSTLDNGPPQPSKLPFDRPAPPIAQNRPPPRPPSHVEPSRPSYGAASRFESNVEPPPAPPPLPIETKPDSYPAPPPAPYHRGNRPTDPPTSVDSPASLGQVTPAEPATSVDEEEPFLGVRSKYGLNDVWVDAPEDPSESTIEATEVVKEEDEHKFFGASHISDYTLQQKLGEGTFGVVYKGVRGPENAVVSEKEREEENENWKRGLRVRKGDVVALKQIIFHNEGDGLPITSVREIRILKQLDHPNVVPVVDMALDPGDPAKLEVGRTFMVFPYMDHDLAGLLENPSVKLEVPEIKQYGKQLLEGTAYLHRNGILHRDMKAANLLINNKGVLMIADFGLARSMEPPEIPRDYTSCVVTRWYRPPELLLGERKYHYPVDMWGVGCILLEMFKRSPIFPGNSDLHQAQLIFAACGPPTEESMPGWSSLPGVEGIDKHQQQWKAGARSLKADAVHYDTEVFADLLDKILVLDPKRRLTASEALDHEWFWVEPFPAEPSRMREFVSSHEYDRRKLKENLHLEGMPQQQQQPMIQPRPQPMPPMGYAGAPPPPPPPGYNFPAAYNGPPPHIPPPPNAYAPAPSSHFAPSLVSGGMGMAPSMMNGGMNGNYQPPPGFPQPPQNSYAANRPPPSTIQQQNYYPGAPPPQPNLDYGSGTRQINQSTGPSWQTKLANRPPAASGPSGGKVNLMDRLRKK